MAHRRRVAPAVIEIALKQTIAFFRANLNLIEPNPDLVYRFSIDLALVKFRQIAAHSGVEAEQWLAAQVHDASFGDDDSDAIIRAIAADRIRSGRMVPMTLRDYVVSALLLPPHKQRRGHKGKPGPNRFVRAGRNAFIKGAIEGMNRRYKIPPTRNSLNKTNASGCSIVAEALNVLGIPMEEGAVQQVWNGWKRSIAREKRASK